MIAITRLTLKEALRKRILLITLLLTMGFLTLYGFGVHFAVASARSEMDGPSSMGWHLLPHVFMSLALFFATFITGFFTISNAIGTVSLEVESGILHAIAPRPVKRSSIILGKSLGYGIIIALYASLFYASIVGVTNVATGIRVPFNAGVMCLFILHPLVLLSVTMLGTTRLSTIANGVLTLMVYAMSVMGGVLEQVGYMLRIEALVNTGIVTSLIMPADSIYRKMVNLALSGIEVPITADFLGPFGGAGEPSAWMLVYAVGYIAFFLGLAVRSFAKRDIG